MKRSKLKKEQAGSVNSEIEKQIQAIVDLENIINAAKEQQEADPNWKINNLEYDLKNTEWVLYKVRTSKSYSQNLYAALCNNEFQKNDTWPILNQEFWSCSWRYAGGIIADMRKEGNYLDWYCSGIRNVDYIDSENQQWDRNNDVAESVVTDEIREDLFKLGWLVVETLKE